MGNAFSNERPHSPKVINSVNEGLGEGVERIVQTWKENIAEGLADSCDGGVSIYTIRSNYWNVNEIRYNNVVVTIDQLKEKARNKIQSQDLGEINAGIRLTEVIREKLNGFKGNFVFDGIIEYYSLLESARNNKMNMGNQFLNKDENEEAIKCFNSVLSNSPNNIEARRGKIKALIKIGDRAHVTKKKEKYTEAQKLVEGISELEKDFSQIFRQRLENTATQTTGASIGQAAAAKAQATNSQDRLNKIEESVERNKQKAAEQSNGKHNTDFRSVLNNKKPTKVPKQKKEESIAQATNSQDRLKKIREMEEQKNQKAAEQSNGKHNTDFRSVLNNKKLTQAREQKKEESTTEEQTKEKFSKLFQEGLNFFEQAWSQEEQNQSDAAKNSFQKAKETLEKANKVNSNDTTCNNYLSAVKLKIEGNQNFNEGLNPYKEGLKLIEEAKKLVGTQNIRNKAEKIKDAYNKLQEAKAKFDEAKNIFNKAYEIQQDSRFKDCSNLVDETLQNIPNANDNTNIENWLNTPEYSFNYQQNTECSGDHHHFFQADN